jgi:hypothetical protein
MRFCPIYLLHFMTAKEGKDPHKSNLQLAAKKTISSF